MPHPMPWYRVVFCKCSTDQGMPDALRMIPLGSNMKSFGPKYIDSNAWLVVSNVWDIEWTSLPSSCVDTEKAQIIVSKNVILCPKHSKPPAKWNNLRLWCSQMCAVAVAAAFNIIWCFIFLLHKWLSKTKQISIMRTFGHLWTTHKPPTNKSILNTIPFKEPRKYRVIP